MGRFEKLIQRLTLAEKSPSVFVGGAGEGGVGGEARLFGGLVAAQAAMAAMNTVADMPIHSLHAYFLRPGRANTSIVFHVEALKDGRNFSSRSVEAWQDGERIFQMLASFQRPADGVEHEPTMPDVAAPDALPNRDQLRGRKHWQDMPIDVRMASPITADEPLEARQQLWIRVNGNMPSTASYHFALAIFASDRSLLDTAWRPHADQGELVGASLDHAMWFHRIPDLSRWLLYDMVSPVAAGARGLATGHLFDEDGRCIVTVAQEGMLRSR